MAPSDTSVLTKHPTRPSSAGHLEPAPLQPADLVGETVELLAACRPHELTLLEGLSGYRKLMMCWRWVGRGLRSRLFATAASACIEHAVQLPMGVTITRLPPIWAPHT